MARSSGTGPIVLTGATGFVGRRLQQALLAAGHSVRALVRTGSRNAAHIQAGCEAVAVDLEDRAALTAVLSDAAAVIYCAGSVRGRLPGDFRPANVHGVRAVAAALASRTRAAPLLLVSSLAASRPSVSDYAMTKHEGERVLQEWPDLPWTVLRPPALYGPGDVEMRPVLDLLRRGFAPMTGPRHQRISLLHVDDFATAVLAWLGNPEACRQRCFELHDGTAGGYDWPSLGRAVAAREVLLLPVPSFALRTAATVNWLLSFALRYAPMLTPGKARELAQETWVADNDAFRAATGWSPAIRLAEGAARLFEASTRD
ncbi:MAG: NAD(P)-dependent oxidoreductase [Steroidobacteraceae bacterium]